MNFLKKDKPVQSKRQSGQRNFSEIELTRGAPDKAQSWALTKTTNYRSTNDSTSSFSKFFFPEAIRIWNSLLQLMIDCIDCTEIPTPTNIEKLLISGVQHMFKIKYLETLYAMHSGASCLYMYQTFWK